MPTLKHACDASPYGPCHSLRSGFCRCVTRSGGSYIKCAFGGTALKQIWPNKAFESLYSVPAPEQGDAQHGWLAPLR